ncbi:MAG: hypothetical protein JNM14_11695 [Ferruginibacter sp.]|nr:hypothetical protein [Ferruginibacter sp.]
MKIIKSTLLVTIVLCATTRLHAQQEKNNLAPQLKPEVLKQEEMKAPPQTGLNTPSPQPELKPQPGTQLPREAAAPSNTKPQQNDEGKSEAKALPKPKTVVLDNGAGDETKNLTPEQQNILNGKSERPKNSGAQVQHSAQQKTTQAQPVNQN